MSIASIQTGKHYVWGGNCDGWHLAASPNLSVIQERVPSGSSEVRHLHNRAEQFFYVLNGIATLEVAGTIYTLAANDGYHVPTGVPHTLSNQHEQTLELLVVSAPPRAILVYGLGMGEGKAVLEGINAYTQNIG